MRKRNLLTTLAVGIVLLPFYASADSVATTTVPGAVPQTEAQVFTACSQAAIEVRDNSIGSARTTYNTAMAAALSARKEAEKNAIAISDDSKKRDAIKAAVDEYRQAVTAAQDGLTKARKEAWAAFEANANKCRDDSKDIRKGMATDTKAIDSRATQIFDGGDAKPEVKTLGESLIQSIKNFFGMGGGNSDQ